jgi:hypothetical protein
MFRGGAVGRITAALETRLIGTVGRSTGRLDGWSDRAVVLSRSGSEADTAGAIGAFRRRAELTYACEACSSTAARDSVCLMGSDGRCGLKNAGFAGIVSRNLDGIAGEWSLDVSALESSNLLRAGFCGSGRAVSNIIASFVTEASCLAAELLLLRRAIPASSSRVCTLLSEGPCSGSRIHFGWLESLSELNSSTACCSFFVLCFQNVPAVFKNLVLSSAAISAGAFSGCKADERARVLPLTSCSRRSGTCAASRLGLDCCRDSECASLSRKPTAARTSVPESVDSRARRAFSGGNPMSTNSATA